MIPEPVPTPPPTQTVFEVDPEPTIIFEPLEPETSEKPPEPKAKIEPFTSDEIIEMAIIAAAFGLQIRTEEEALAFKEAFEWIAPPILATRNVVETIGLGKALAKYGIGKGSLPGGGELPPYITIAAGVLGLAMAGFRAVGALREERNKKSQ